MSDSIEDLVNRGVLSIRVPKSHPHQRTLIVLGAPRGGTTMAAGCLHHLGVPMGDSAGPVVFEDQVIGKSLDRGDLRGFRLAIANMNASYPVWGWKRPSAFRHLDLVAAEFREPYFIAIFRDPVAVALREHISMRFDPTPALEVTLETYSTIARFLSETNRPVLAVSYEKALRYPLHFVEALVGFVGPVSNESIDAALAFIDPEPEFYLSRSHRRHGSTS